MKQLHPRAVWLFFFRTIPLLLVLAWILSSFVSFLLFFASSQGSPEIAQQLATLFTSRVTSFFLPLLFILILSYIWARLSYRYYRYELTENGFKKELGVILKKYVTIPYDRIQNVDIYRGILDRILGLSDLNIQTAGMSSVGRSGRGVFAEGRLPGLSKEDAEKLRDELINRAQKSKSQGL